jgi:hypothetical protein
MKYFALLLLLMWARCGVLAADEKPAGLRIRLYQVPASFFADKEGRLVSGVKAIPQEHPDSDAAQYDVREFLEQWGCKFAPEDEAIYQPARESLVIRARQVTFDAIEGMHLDKYFWDLPSLLRIEVTLVEFSTADMSKGEVPSSYDALRKAARDSWRVVDRVAVVAKSGQRATSVSKTGAPDPKSAAPAPAPNPCQKESSVADGLHPLQPGEAGTQVEAELVLAPDESTTDVILAYSYRAQEHGGLEWNVTTALTGIAGKPLIAQFGPVAADVPGAGPTRMRALVVRVDVLDLRPKKFPAEKDARPQPAKP